MIYGAGAGGILYADDVFFLFLLAFFKIICYNNDL